MIKNGKKLISMVVVLTFLISMFSFSVLAESTNLAAGKTVIASSFDSAGLEGSKVVDGVIDASHEWYSYGDTNEWVRINLGSAQSFNQVKVYWGTGYAAGYKLQGSSNGTTYSDITGATITNGTGGTATISFTAVSYQYVRLYTTTEPTGNYGHEIMELEVYGDSGTSIPSTPTGLTTAASSTSSINTSWNVVSGATGYHLYRVGTTAAIYTGTATSYTDTGLSANTQYSYQVAAFNTAGESSKSSSESATTQNQQSYTNIVAGKSFTSSTSCTGASYVTDGDASTSNYYADLAGANVQWIQFDLGEGAVTNSVKLWHYYSGGRTYNDVIVQLSNDSSFATGVTTVFNNDTNNSAGRGTGTDAAYAESSTGKTITVNNVTAQYIRFYTNGSSSNTYNHYVEVQVLGTAGSTTTPPVGTYNVYYGMLHNHSALSDGQGTPDQAYAYARDTADMDFFGLADHDEQLSSSEWSQIKNTANQYNQDNVFAAFYGFEWSSRYGHVAVINLEEMCNHNDIVTFDNLVSWLSTRNCVAFLNHPGREDDHYNYEFSHFNTLSDKVVGMELWNNNNGGENFNRYYYGPYPSGEYGYYNNDGNKTYYDEALLRGLKIGASGSADNHSATWGTENENRLAVLAEGKTRASIFEALQARRFFSTLDKNLTLSFKINGNEMGSTIAAGTYNAVINAGDGNSEVFTEVYLLKNGEVFQSWTPNTTNPQINSSISCNSGDYFYIRVKQADNSEAISSPIWVN